MQSLTYEIYRFFPKMLSAFSTINKVPKSSGYFPVRFSTAMVMVRTPVRMLGSGTG
jgi:hypothetical protein